MDPRTPPNPPSLGLDYLGATVRGVPPMGLIGTLSDVLRAEPRTEVAPRGYGYRQAVALRRGDELAALVLADPQRDPFVIAQGYRAPDVQACLTAEAPQSSAARKDVAVDLDDPDWFDVAFQQAVALANRGNLTTDMRGDWMSPGSPKGRTFYVGARTSVNLIRIYEFRKCHGYGPHVRIELEHKPQRPADKDWLFAAQPRDVIARSRTMCELLRLIGVDVSHAVPRAYRKPLSDVDRAVNALLTQYGNILREGVLPQLEGDITALGPWLFERLNELELARRQISHAAAPSLSTREALAGVAVGE